MEEKEKNDMNRCERLKILRMIEKGIYQQRICPRVKSGLGILISIIISS